MNAGGNVIHLRELLQDDGLAAVFVSLGDIDGVSQVQRRSSVINPFCAAIHRTTPETIRTGVMGGISVGASTTILGKNGSSSLRK